MDKDKLIIWSLILVVFSLCGCETAVGFGKGFANGISSAAQGAKKDTSNFCNFIKETDDWMRKYMW